MRHSALKTTTILVLVLTLGLHWALLQTVAWTGMIIAYSQDNSLRDAVRMTFDGDHPCCLCKAIKQGRTEQKQQEKIAPSNKLPLAIIWQAPFFCFDPERELIAAPDTTFTTRAEAPPKPRPRAAAAPSLAC